MAIWQAIILGLVQGLSEFIPVSSTAHVTIVGRLLGVVDANNPEEWTSFQAVVQFGTLGAVLVYFFPDIVRICRGFVKSLIAKDSATMEERRNGRLGWLVILGTIPIVILGLAFKDIIQGDITKDLRVISSTLIGIAILLWIAEKVGKRERGIEKMKTSDAAIVGISQVISLIPGSSRSGSTIAGGLFAGMTREGTARFSFLLSILVIGGSALFEAPDALNSSSYSAGTLAVAIIAAAISGFAAIAFLLRYLQRHSTHVFIYYRIVLGVVLLAMVLSGVMNAK